MEEIIIKLRGIGIDNIDKILKELNKYKLEEIQKMVLVKKAFNVDSSVAHDIVLSEYRNPTTDSLLDIFLNYDNIGASHDPSKMNDKSKN